ncbi:MAG: hypothetical protein ACRD3W_09155, partial [Terriglobales bacterium]
TTAVGTMILNLIPMNLKSLNLNRLNLNVDELAIECGIEPSSPDRWSQKSSKYPRQSENEV